MNPFMSCGARLPIYALFISIFFRNHGGIVLFCLYTGGIVLSILTGFLLRKTILQGESSNFIMELPPYHMPTINGVFYHTWNRLKGFVFRAGKVIIIAILFLNFLNSLGTDGSFGNNDSDKSVLAAIGKKITPVFAPMGISENNWPATVGLFGGIFAKEAVAGILKSLYEQQEQEKLREVTEGEKKYEISKTLKDTMGFSNESETENSEFDFRGGIAAAFKSIPEGFKGFWGSLKDPLGISETISSGKDKGFQNDLLFSDTLEFNAMKSHFGNNYSAIAYLIFILIYAPCLAAIAAIYRETDMKWMLFSVLYLTGLAWISSVAFYQTAVLFTQATLGSVIWLTVCGTLLAVFCFILKIFSSINAKILD
jgi:ferrous iron transport protein B